jgi:hypothetical protein
LSDRRRADHRGAHAWSSTTMVNVLVLQPIIALVAGILILLIPRLLNIIVAVYLIVIGVSGLWPHLLR